MDSVLSLAMEQLSLPSSVPPRLIPDEYIEELTKHISLYPNDTNFLTKRQPGKGFGQVTCLEVRCGKAVIDLVKRVDLPDGGFARGYGSLSAYRVHIAENLPAHEESHRSKRVNAQARRAAPFPMKVEYEVPLIKPEPSESSVPLKRRSRTEEDAETLKRIKFEHPMDDPEPLAILTNSPTSIRDRLSDIQTQIITNRRLLDTVQRKTRKSTSDKTREARFLSTIKRLETEKSSLDSSLFAFTSVRDIGRSRKLSIKTPVKSSVINVLDSPEEQVIYRQPAASGFKLPMPEDEPMLADEFVPMTYTVKDDEINKFLINAGNGAFFDREATVEESLKALGLKDLFTPLPGLKICLMSHQVLAVDWMAKQERNKAMMGGCLADEMGLGKTVQMIALMVKNRSENPKCRMNLVVAPLALLDQWQMEIEEKTDCDLKCYIHHGQGKLKKRSDMEKYDVVLTTFGTVMAEFADPEAEKEPKKRKKKKTDDFIVDDEEDVKPVTNIRKKGSGILFDIDWYRVVLDEAHNIRNKRTRVSRAVVELRSVYRWGLTGTPIINTLSDAYGMLRFLRIRPWYDWQDFNPHISLIEKKNPNLATQRLQTIFKACLLRRRKDSLLNGKRLIELPPKEINLIKLQFTQEELEVYKMVETRSQAIFNRFLRAGTVLKNYTQVLVMLLRLRQICSHPALITDPETSMEILGSNSSEYDRAVKTMGRQWVQNTVSRLADVAAQRMTAELESVDAAIDDECPVCFDISTEVKITECGHIYCNECIANVLNAETRDDAGDGSKYKANERPCPVCRAPISSGKTFDLKAFEPNHIEESVVESQPKWKGKGRMVQTPESDEDDTLEGFIVADESDDDYKPKMKRRLGKRRANVVLDSDEEDDYEDVVIKPKAVAQVSAGTPIMMKEHQLSTKMVHLMKLLKNWKSEEPDDKVVIISQWTRYLDIVSDYLTSEGFVHVRYQGSMSRHERNRAVRTFMKADNNVPVMLMSLKCGGVGLNLTRANHVISLDLSWSLQVESQSYDRVHRLGQTKAVTVERLVIKDTVEDRILELQDKKKALSDGSLGEGGGQKIGRLTVKQLAGLFGLDHRGRVL